MKEKKNETRKRADRFALWLLRYNGGLLNVSDVIKKYREIMDEDWISERIKASGVCESEWSTGKLLSVAELRRSLGVPDRLNNEFKYALSELGFTIKSIKFGSCVYTVICVKEYENAAIERVEANEKAEAAGVVGQ